MSKKSSQSQVFDKVEDAVFTFRIKKKTVQGAKGDKEEERRRERNKERNGEGRKDNDIRGFYAQEKVERKKELVRVPGLDAAQRTACD